MNIDDLYSELTETLKKSENEFEYEIVLVDDGSLDSSYDKMKELQAKDKHFKIMRLSRNFGAHTAILAGLSHCTGDAAVIIMADLQDPPEIILQMYEKYIQGNDVVLAVRKDREDGFITKCFSNSYYRLMRRFALKEMPYGGFDCFLIDRKVIEILKNMKEKNSSIGGQVLWCGFKTDKIFYVRRKRAKGKSKWTLSKKIKLFVDSFMSFSYVPIRTMSAAGICLAFAGFLYAIFVVYQKLVVGINVDGWATLVILFLLVSGVQMTMLGVIGEYLWRNLDETKKRPIFIVADKQGFDD